MDRSCIMASLEMNVYTTHLENLVRSPMIGTQPRETADKIVKLGGVE